MSDFLKTKFALPAIVAAGVLLVVLIVKLQPEMSHNPQARPSVMVNAITLEEHNLRPSITGFGKVEPDLTLSGKAEVTGRVTYIHPNLKKGAILPKGTVVLRIDDKDYQLALRQAQADLLSNKASLNEMQLTIENNKLDLKLANEKLKVRQAELKRLVQLRKTGAVSQSKLDQERQNMLQQQQEVQQLENKQTTLPSDLAVLEAKIDISASKVERSERDLARTEIVLPFSARVRQVNAELDQYVTAGSLLFDVSGLDKVVINAQFPLEQFRQIAAGFDKSKLNLNNLTTSFDTSSFFTSLGLSATVNIAGHPNLKWDAKVERFSDNLDPQSHTIGVVVSVSGSYENIDPIKRPPLLEGNYMEVKLQGASSRFLVLPRFSLHENQFYLIDENNTLQRVDVNEVELQGDLALLKNTLKVGTRVITSDVFPAVNGMSVTVVDDVKTQQQMQQWVRDAQ
ncbi:efflux RND transporter periplasmic adaptor subunit [Colwelliaceae bacterium 6471]